MPILVPKVILASYCPNSSCLPNWSRWLQLLRDFCSRCIDL